MYIYIHIYTYRHTYTHSPCIIFHNIITHIHISLSLSIYMYTYVYRHIHAYLQTHTHTYIYTHTYTSLCSKVSGSKNTELSVSILSASPLKGGFWSWPQKNSLHCCSTSQAGKKCRSTGGSSSNRNSNSKRATPTEH